MNIYRYIWIYIYKLYIYILSHYCYIFVSNYNFIQKFQKQLIKKNNTKNNKEINNQH